MIFFEDKKKVRYNPYDMKYDKKIGSGLEANVYLIGDEVVKLYNDNCEKIRLGKDEIEKMSKINTKRIIMPKIALLDKKHHIRGYKMKYINNLGYYSFFKISKDKLNEELSILENDIELLDDNNILLDDLNISNTIFNNGIYLIDPGSYTINNLVCVEGINKDRINEYLVNLIIEYIIIKYGKKSYKIMFDIRNQLQKYNAMDYLKNNLEFDSIDKFVEYEYKKVR